MQTIVPGVLTIMSAYPDPPFDVTKDGVRTGFDIELIRAISGRLALRPEFVAYPGDDFNGIFPELIRGKCDAVISGTTITPERAAIVRFSEPYLEFNQAIAVNRLLSPDVYSTSGLHGLTAGIQRGNTSDIVARRLLAEGKIAAIKYYPYDGIDAALDDLQAGRIGLIIKLFPVLAWLTRARPNLIVAMQVPTHEKLGIAYAPDNTALCDAVNSAIDALKQSGEFAKLQSAWPDLDASLL